MTLKEIADACGVSVSTVSLVLNNKGDRISNNTRNKILEFAKENHFIKNRLAQGLNIGKTQILGLIIPDLGNEFFARLASILSDAVYKNNYNLILCASNNDAEQELQHLKTLLGYNVDGLFIVETVSSDPVLNNEFSYFLNHTDKPIIFIDRKNSQNLNTSFVTNNFKGGYFATKHLISLGHKRIGHLTGPMSLLSSNDRFSGYKAALIDSNIPFEEDLVFEGDFLIQSGVSSMPYFLGKKCSGLFCANDMMAYGMIMYASKNNINIPRDISIIGYDNNVISEACFPTLTTMAQSIERICIDAATHMLKCLNDVNTPVRNFVYQPNLVIRESTSPPFHH